MTLRSWLKETLVVRGLKMRVISSAQWFFVRILRSLLPDALLRAGVAEHGEIDNWKIIALTIPGRTNKACRKVILPVVDIFSQELISLYLSQFSVGYTPSNPMSRKQPGVALKTSFY